MTGPMVLMSVASGVSWLLSLATSVMLLVVVVTRAVVLTRTAVDED